MSCVLLNRVARVFLVAAIIFFVSKFDKYIISKKLFQTFAFILHFGIFYYIAVKLLFNTHLFSGNIPGLCWENKEQTIFRMPWKHAGRQDYNLEEDSKIFMVNL